MPEIIGYRMRPFVTLVLLVLTTVPSIAQHSGFGIKGGAVLSNTKSGNRSSNWLPGAAVGGYFALRAGPRLELQPEVLIASLGASYALPDGERGAVRTLYAQVPLSVKAFIGNVFNAQAGLTMGRLLLAQQTAPGAAQKVTDAYNSWDYGVHLGLGADLVSGYDIGLRYYSGLQPVLANDATYFPRNRAYMATLGYRMARIRAPRMVRRRH
jgi:hypothetical protein